MSPPMILPSFEGHTWQQELHCLTHARNSTEVREERADPGETCRGRALCHSPRFLFRRRHPRADSRARRLPTRDGRAAAPRPARFHCLSIKTLPQRSLMTPEHREALLARSRNNAPHAETRLSPPGPSRRRTPTWPQPTGPPRRAAGARLPGAGQPAEDAAATPAGRPGRNAAPRRAQAGGLSGRPAASLRLRLRLRPSGGGGSRSGPPEARPRPHAGSASPSATERSEAAPAASVPAGGRIP